MRKFVFIILLILVSFQLFAYNFGKNKIQNSKMEWEKIESLHFDIYYPSHNKEFGKLAVLIPEEAYYQLKEDFQRPVMNRIPIIL